MKLDVTLALRTPGVEYPFEGTQAIAPQSIFGETVTFDEATLRGNYLALDNGSIKVKGTLATIARGRCANCLKEAETPISAEYDELFLLGGDTEDDEVFTYTSSQVDMERLTLTFALLEMPMRLLCRQGCKGRPEGYRMAAGDSASRPSAQDAPMQRPFAALQQLLDSASDTEESSESLE